MCRLIIKVPVAKTSRKIRRNVCARAIGPPSISRPNQLLGPRSDKRKSACLVGWRRDEQYFATQLELNQFVSGVSTGGIC